MRLSTGNASRFTPRQTTSGRGRLDYNLYIDAARTQIWGDGTGGSTLRTLVPVNNAPTILSIFDRIPPRQFVPAGIYSDTIVVTLEY
ncbi:spore coat protein U domain-containing protein [Thermosynechococcus sp. HN-54]|uniref:spore coat protein U domain-containing protein n=1 Tax=Thermosynechococcus sp. HN-54 TaxID=2933959 RepID=UPI0037DC53A8